MRAARWLSASLLIAAAPAGTSPRAAAPQEPRWEVVRDLADTLAGPSVVNPAGAAAAAVAAGGVTRGAISQHPAATGAPLVRIEYRRVALPPVRGAERLALRFAVGIRDGFSRDANPRFDGCAFIVEVEGCRVFRRAWAEQRWSEERVDLTSLAGRTAAVAFLTDPLTNSAYDWAAWGAPRIVIEGRRATPKPIPAVPFLRLDALLRAPEPERVLESRRDGPARTLVAVMDRSLDLPAQLRDTARVAGPPAAPLPPPMVAGEGPDPANHTLVRVLGRHGIAEAQFLAFAPGVRGGVAVAAGRRAGGAAFVCAAPLADAGVREIRVFTDRGGPLMRIRPPASVGPPYAITAGDLVASRAGDEVAVASRSGAGGRTVLLYAADGRLLRTVRLPAGLAGALTLSRARASRGDELVVHAAGSRRVVRLPAAAGAPRLTALPALPAGAAVYAGVGRELVAALPGTERSEVTRLTPAGEARTVEVGARERRFWAAWYGTGWEQMPDGRYTRHATFRHIRTDGASPGAADPASPEAAFAGPVFRKWVGQSIAAYESGQTSVWEPCFSHRWHKGRFQAWRDAVDPQTGLPRYVMLTRNNHPAEYGEFGTVDFYSGTYAFGLPEIERLNVLPLRAFLRGLATPFRRHPERIVCLEPNHEHEIAVEAEGTMGDYNPRMVEGFFHYLTALYGRDLAGLNRVMGSSFTRYFDAPRRWERGSWDAYDGANPLYREWIAYNRYVVNRRLAQTFREALLAGFPPEIVTCHQIPDAYAVGHLDAFSSVTARFTPVDWALSAGTGFGFTRYGVWYRAPHDMVQDAHAAGFGMMSIGEYQALTPDVEAAFGQLRFLADHGVAFAHCMSWPAEHDRGFNASMDAALRRLFAEDRPRPGVAGGVGEVRTARAGGRECAVVCVGSGPDRTGLLKSVRADGSWEGSVYVMPFHAHVAVTPLPVARTAAGEPWVCGPLKGLASGCQVDLLFRASGTRAGVGVTWSVRRGGRVLPGLMGRIAVGRAAARARCILRVQLPVDGVEVALRPDSGVRVSEVSATLEREETPRVAEGRLEARAHRGGVTFDVWR